MSARVPPGTPALQKLRDVVAREVAPHAALWDREQALPRELPGALARAGLVAVLPPCKPPEGAGLDWATYGSLQAEVGRFCTSTRAVLTVQEMVAAALGRCGTREQRERWLPALRAGEAVAAFALTEPGFGSDARHVATSARRTDRGYVLGGTKVWITAGEIADVALVLAQLDGAPTAFLVERGTPGLVVEPIRDVLGLRAARLARLTLDGCEVPAESLVGQPGAGLAHVVATALDVGRFAVAWGSVGMAQACLDASLTYAAQRHQFGVALENHQLVKRLLARMRVHTHAAALVCEKAAALHDDADPEAVPETLVAKYLAAEAAEEAAGDAVQLHGAVGCTGAHVLERFYRDAKIMTIIEGTTQILEVLIADHASRAARARRPGEAGP